MHRTWKWFVPTSNYYHYVLLGAVRCCVKCVKFINYCVSLSSEWYRFVDSAQWILIFIECTQKQMSRYWSQVGFNSVKRNWKVKPIEQRSPIENRLVTSTVIAHFSSCPQTVIFQTQSHWNIFQPKIVSGIQRKGNPTRYCVSFCRFSRWFRIDGNDNRSQSMAMKSIMRRFPRKLPTHSKCCHIEALCAAIFSDSKCCW